MVSDIVSGIKAKKVASYVLLPGIIPRAKRLFASGFGYIAFLMAHIYNMVRLIPANHPYLQEQNIGKFGLRHVIAEAANNLVVKKENIDQIIIFGALLAAIAILFTQFILLVYGLLLQPAFAGPPNVGSIFNTPDPVDPKNPVGAGLVDIAFVLMDRVFGVPDLFCNVSKTCTTVATAGGGFGADWRSPFQIALHSMFQFYSLGLLIIGVLIFSYFMVVVVLETAVTGSPFGQRFKNVWVPIRLVVALGLLVPVSYGLNSAQYITLYAAKYGSGFATYGWTQFNKTLEARTDVMDKRGTKSSSNPSGESKSLLAAPQAPDITPVVEFMSIAHACAYAHWKSDPNVALPGTPPSGDIKAMNLPGDVLDPRFYIRPYFIKNPLGLLSGDPNHQEEVFPGTSYLNALKFFDNSDIVITFGTHDPRFTDFIGNVEPTCGSIRVKIADLAEKGCGKATAASASCPNGATGGADQIQQFYYDLVLTLWFGIPPIGSSAGNKELAELSWRFVERQTNFPPAFTCSIGCKSAPTTGPGAGLFPASPNSKLPACPQPGTETGPCLELAPGSDARQDIILTYQGLLDTEIKDAWEKFNTKSDQISLDTLDYGWAGAGIWYNKIAQVNGAFVSAIVDVPSVAKMPIVMEKVKKAKLSEDAQTTGDDCVMDLKEGQAEIDGGPNTVVIAQTLCSFYEWWNKDGANQIDPDKKISKNFIKDGMNLVFGTSGLFAMRGLNAHVHPIAQLTSMGKSLVEASVRNVLISSAMAAGGGAASALSPHFGKLLSVGSNFISQTAFVGLTVGVILYYILPFLPFLYFFFAVGTWVKGIFEAMVGVPLWALAHLRLEGEGLPGASATNGYFLIFDIFLRPILTVFGLVAATIIFTAQVRVLNVIWGLVVDNITGFESDPLMAQGFKDISRGVLDEFFFTIIYAVIVYMLATASFKLVDTIPNDLLRWMGGPVASFGDMNKDPVDGLQRYAAMGGITLGQQATGAINKAAGGVGGAAGKLLSPGP